MLILSTTILALLVPALAALAPEGVAGPPDQEAPRCCELYPAASGELVVEVGDDNPGPKLDEIALLYADLTGQRLIYTNETAGLLQHQTSGLRGSLRVPAEEVQSFFEVLMISNDFLIHPLRKEQPRLLQIESLRTQARNTVRAGAHWIPEEQLEHFAKHPATLVATLVEMPNTDVRQLSNSMRTMITDANTQQMLPAGNTNSLVLVGFGAQVGELQAMLKRVDVASKIESAELEVIPLAHAKANDVFRTLLPLVQPPRVAAKEGAAPTLPPGAPNLVVDERMNSLVVSARAKDMARIKALVEQLDREKK